MLLIQWNQSLLEYLDTYLITLNNKCIFLFFFLFFAYLATSPANF